jgi:hypothetical protein
VFTSKFDLSYANDMKYIVLQNVMINNQLYIICITGVGDVVECVGGNVQWNGTPIVATVRISILDFLIHMLGPGCTYTAYV